MILKSLYLKNIRSYEELNLDFQTGTSLFEGDIGSGKSTILMAIEFALFGLGGIRGNSLLRAGENSGTVRLVFSVDGEDYEVQRRLKKARKNASQDSKGCYIKDSNGKLPLTPSELKPRILEILNFNEPSAPQAKSVIFTYAIFTPQEEMKSIILERPEKRLETLRKAFRIEDYKIAAANAKSLYKQIEDRVRYLEGAASGLDQDEIAKKELETSIKEDSKKIKPLEKQEMDESKLREKIKQDLLDKRQEQVELSKIAGKLPEVKKRVEGNEKEVQRLVKAIEKETGQIEKTQTEIKKLNEIDKPTEKTVKDIKGEINEIEKSEKTLMQNHGAVKQKIIEYQSVKDNGTCPTCDRPADPKEFEDKAKSKETEVQQIQTELDRLNTLKKEANKLLEDLQNYEKNQEKIEGLTEQLEGCQGRIKESNERKDGLEKQIKEDKGFIKKAETKHKELESINEKIKELEKQDQDKENTIKDISGQISGLKERIEKSKEQIEALKTTIENKQKSLKLTEKLNEYIVWIRDYFVPTVESIEKSVLANINEEFNEKFRSWFSFLVEDNTKDARIDEDFTPIVEQDGYEQDIQYLSGGEKTSVALSYRLVLNSLVQKVSTGMKSNLLILDEPTDGFSKEQLFKVRDILNELQCPQVILVSHERELESFADNIYRIVKTNGVSVVS